MPPNHVTTFSPEGLRMLFEAHGWQIMSLKMHERNSLVARCKHGVMRGIIHPDGHIQRMLSLAYLRSSSRLGKLPLFVFAGLMLLTNPSLVRPVPPEEIWLHAKRKSFSQGLRAQINQSLVSECAPDRTRTDTGRILSPLSLPLDYGGQQNANTTR